MSKNIIEELQKPFKPQELECRLGATNKTKTKGIALIYVTNRAIQERLDNVFGIFGWKNEFKEWKGGQLCGISVLHEGQWITKWDGAENTQFEALKGGLSDSMKRAAYQWGIGRYLYKIPNTWVNIKPQGKSFVIELPGNNIENIIPKEFLPEKYIPNKITSIQLKKLMAVANKAKISDEKLKNAIKVNYGLDSKKDLNQLQFQSIIKRFENIIKETNEINEKTKENKNNNKVNLDKAN